uniref:Uncharacterized protein n=1 Tax=Amicula sp. isolate GU52X-4 cfCalB7 TaxID=3003489 RepID=A0A9E8Z239_9STRA|nr:hypothetical protein [Amicula sp. isolate GU52X-4 cfCalB7]
MKLRKYNFKSTDLSSLLFMLGYLFYFSFRLGYSFSKIFYDFFDQIHRNDFNKMIQFRKNFNLKNIIKFILRYIFKFFRNYLLRVFRKGHLVIKALAKVYEAFKEFLKKFKFFKLISQFKYNYQLLKELFCVILRTFKIILSFFKELFFWHKIIEFLMGWVNILLFLMSEPGLISIFASILWIILLGLSVGLWGLIFGFLLGVYLQENEIDYFTYVFISLLLLKILYARKFLYGLNPSEIDQFPRFSLRTIEQFEPRPLKLIFKNPEEIPLPLGMGNSIIDDNSIIDIRTEVFIEETESINYQFELVKFYGDDFRKKI